MRTNTGRRIDRTRRAIVPALVGSLLALGAGAALGHSTPYGQELYWTEDLASPSGRHFGANQSIVIYQGSMTYVPGPLCTGFDGGQNDFIYPATDVYIVESGSVQDYGELEDVSGVPNTVIAQATGGLFIDERIGVAGGKFPPEFEEAIGQLDEQLPALVGEGTYDVVYDECQDGKFQPTLDALFEDVIVVDFGFDVPGFPSAQLQQEKKNALAMRKATTELHDILEDQFDAGYAAASVTDPTVKFIKELGTKTMFADPAAVTLQLYDDLAKHYNGIFADPPDPAFDQPTLLGPAAPPPAHTADPAREALVEATVALETEARLAESLLHAMERYQGAEAVNDGKWALAQAREIARYAGDLQAQLGRAETALEAYAAAVAADPADLEAGAAELAALAADVAAGDDEELVRVARNAGLGATQIEEIKSDLLATDWAAWDRADVSAAVGRLAAENDHLAAVLPGFALAMADAIAALEAEPGVQEPFPVADAGGPYEGMVGVPVALDGSASLGGRLPIAGYEIDAWDWDLDGDGIFDDATGPTPSVTFARPYHGLVAVRVTNGLNAYGRHVAYARADISSTNQPPTITSASPAGDPDVEVGSAQPFSVAVGDPDGDPVTVAWRVDGALVGSGLSHAWTPLAAGVHAIEVIATDPEGAAITRSWLALALEADGDGDGWNANTDCDDADAGRNPGLPEIVGNAIDDDCDSTTPDSGSPPVAAFSVTPTAPAPGQDAVFADHATDPNEDIVAWAWDFGDGFTSSLASPTHAFATRGAYDVTLTVTDAQGTTDTATAIVRVSAPPSAGFTFAPASPAVGGEVEFRDASTDDGSVASFSWDFGDGVTSTAVDPVHVYDAPGTYDVTLQVTDDDGLTDAAVKQVTVSIADPATAPAAAFAAQASFNLGSRALGAAIAASSGHCCGGHEPIQMLDEAPTEPPWATTSAAGTHYATVALAGGATLPIDRIQVQPRTSTTYASQRVKDFTIEVSSNGTSFTPVLTAQTANNDQLQTFTLPAGTSARFVKYRPLTNWGSSTNISTARLTVLTRRIGPRVVTFDNLSVNAVSYRWDFGDGTPASTAASPTHAFPTAGVYTVTLVAKSADGRSNTMAASYQVVGPVAGIAVDLDAPEAGEPVVFTSTSTDTLGAITSWSWSFGDGTTSPNPSEVHAYASAGTYQVSLTVSDAHGYSDTTNRTVTVGPSDGAPRALFSPVSAGENTALASAGATVTSFSSQSSASYPPSQIIDSSAASRWTTASTDVTRSVVIDLAGGERSFDRIRIAPANGNERVREFAVDLSNDGTTFSNILLATAQASDLLQEFVLNEPASARFIRLRLLSNQAQSGNAISVAAFEVISGGGTNLALLEGGASIAAYSSTYGNAGAPTWLIDGNTDPTGWWATLPTQPLGWVKVDLPGTAPRQIDRIRLMPKVIGSEAVKDFEIAVSTTGTADADYTTVLRATAANATTLQEFLLPRPLPATSILYRIRSNWGGNASVTSTVALKVLSGQLGGATVAFRNLSRAAGWYHWDFGDGTTSAEPNPVHTYAADGTYRVTLTAGSARGTDTFSLDQIVSSAAFEWEPDQPGMGDGTAFRDTSPFLAEHTAWTWRFGDGTTSDATAPVKTFASTGAFGVAMHGISPEGVTNVATATVNVVPVTELRTLFRPSGSANVASSEAGATVVSFTSQYDGNHGPANMLDRNAVSTALPWATANGSKTGSVVVQLARGGSDGPYLVDAIQVMPRPNNATQRVKRFEVAVSTTGTAAGDFATVLTGTAADNGNLQTFALPKPVLARYVRYTVLDNRGDACCTSTQQFRVLTGQVGGPTVSYQNLSLNAITYLWDFGDGTTSTDVNPTHTFAAPGQYTVTLTATGTGGETRQLAVRQRVLALPAPAFIRSVASPAEGQPTTFTSTTPVPPDGPVVDSRWTWGDGTAQVTGTPANHTYVDDGTYTVRLTVTDAWEQQAFLEQPITVVNVAPVANAGPDWQWREEQRLRFDPAISDAGTADTWTCLWTYGDGTSAAGCTFDHTYPDPGDFDTTLTVTDSDGGVSTDTVHVKVIAKASSGGGGGGGGSTGSGEVVASTDRIYTLDPDFERGTLLNVSHTETPDALELNRTTSPFPFIWIAASARGTALRIDVNTGAILGEYRTAPENRAKNPSRTTVDQYGNVWVTNRDEAETRTIDGETTQWGSIARIGLIIGGERVDSSGASSATGEYLKAPFQYSTCIDRNGDGLIRTSRGRGNILGWPNTSGVDHDGGVETAVDECIVIYTRVHGINTRTVAVDANNDVWVGGANQVHEKLDGVTGLRIPGTRFTKGCGGYGGLIDGNGVLWSARYGTGLLRYDTTTASGSCLGNTKGDYGLGIDPVTGNIWQSYLNGNRVVKISPAGTELGRYPHGSDRAQGVAVDASGNVWVTSSVDVGTTLGRVRTDGTFVGSVNLQPGFGIPNGHGPSGVAIDAAGRPWVANFNSSNAQRIDPEIGPLNSGGRPIGHVDLTVDLGAGAGPYNYSDMTGFVAIGSASPQGFWTIVQDGGVADVPWQSISWNGATPTGTSIEVEARAANSQTELASTSFITISDGSAGGLSGRYIEVRATLRTTDISKSPRLDDIRITADVGTDPVADAGGPYTTAEGTPVTLDGSGSSDADGDTLTYTWDLDGDGEYDDSTDVSPTITPGDGPATLVAGLRVDDTSGASSTDEAEVSVANVAPSATLGVDPAAVAEGGTYTVSLAGPADPSAADTAAGFEYAFDCGLGDGYGAWGTETSAACTAGDDDTDPTVRARIRDKDGGTREYEAVVTVTNGPPSGTFGATSPIDEGSSSALAWTGATDPSAADAALLRYAFACDGLLASLTGSWTLASATADRLCPFDDSGEYSVAGRVLDPDNASTTTGALVTVANVAPSATLVAPAAPVAEGGTFTVSLAGPADPSAADTAAGFEYAFDCGLGDGYGAWGTETSAACTAGDDGTLTVRARIRDKDGGARAYEAEVSVANVAPSATLGVDPAAVAEGGTYTVSLAGPADPSAADTAAGFEYAFDCGLGDGYGAWGTETSAACTAGDDDTDPTVRARIRDKDGGVSRYEGSVTVSNAGPSASPSNDGPAPWGHAINFAAGADDPSASDAASLVIAWDLDSDGDYDDASGSTARWTWVEPGTYVVGVRACDPDGACATATSSAEVRRHATELVLGGPADGQYSDAAGVTATLRDTTDDVPIPGATVTLTLGTQAASDTTGSTGVARPLIVLDQAAGATALDAAFATTALYRSASVAGTFTVLRERATISYAGDTFATGTQVRLAATMTEDADGSLGSITRARVTFDVYVGATACGSGSPTRYGPVAVVDTGTADDGIGTAEITMATPGEQTYCIVSRLTGTDPTTPNGYYTSLPAQASVLTVVTTTGKFATGGGWVVDPDTGGHGNFGFTARFTKNGSPKGQAVYVWRTEYNGTTADFIVKSNAITNITFSDEMGNGTFPWRATLDGKATLRINRASDGGELFSDGNATFRLVAVDSGVSSGRGVDSFALIVLDKAGSTYKVAGTWTSGMYSAGIPLSGGNVVVHLR